VWLFGGVGVGWNTARLHFDFEPSLALIRRPLALSPTSIAFHVMICTFAFCIVTPGRGGWRGLWRGNNERFQSWAFLSVSTSTEMEDSSRNIASLSWWRGCFLPREVKLGSIKCRNDRGLFTALPSVYPVSMMERKWKWLIYAFYFNQETRDRKLSNSFYWV
jgi:hypothetical protein